MLIELMIQYTQVELNNLPYSVAEVLAILPVKPGDFTARFVDHAKQAKNWMTTNCRFNVDAAAPVWLNFMTSLEIFGEPSLLFINYAWIRSRFF